MGWDELTAILKTAESTDSRICRVWHPDGPPVWHGMYGGARVESGPAAYQTNDGAITAL